MSHVSKLKVALNLDRKKVLGKVEFGHHVVDEMTGNSNFGAVTPIYPPLADITTATDELETASQNAIEGTKEDTAILHEKEAIFDVKITALGNYVESIANEDAATAESVILSAGMDVKKQNEPIGELLQPQNLRGDYGSHAGEVDLKCDPVKGARAYLWLESDTPNNPASFRMKNIIESTTTKSEYTFSDLVSGKEYGFKVVAVGAAGLSPFSDVMIHRAR